MKPLYLALLAPIIGTTGQILLKASMNRIGKVGSDEISQPLPLILRLITDPMLIAAALLYFMGFVLWLVVLSQLELSKAYPILALSYCFVTLASWFIFGEHVSALRWAGVAVVCVGVVMVGFS